tara:strand:- start:252 stop:686 length:435 start_codon:yes stop_codon:yes gene_type:complete
MGRYIKKIETMGGSNALAIQIPTSSNSVGPQVVDDGMLRWNTDNRRIEFWYENAWLTVAKVGSVGIEVNEFTGDNSTQTFTMSQAESDANAVIVQIGGVYQQPNVNYTMNGSTTITFTSAPPAPGVNPNKIVVVHNINSTDAAY